MSPSLFSSLRNRLSSGKLATSFLLLNSSHSFRTSSSFVCHSKEWDHDRDRLTSHSLVWSLDHSERARRVFHSRFRPLATEQSRGGPLCAKKNLRGQRRESESASQSLDFGIWVKGQVNLVFVNGLHPRMKGKLQECYRPPILYIVAQNLENIVKYSTLCLVSVSWGGFLSDSSEQEHLW